MISKDEKIKINREILQQARNNAICFVCNSPAEDPLFLLHPAYGPHESSIDLTYLVHHYSTPTLQKELKRRRTCCRKCHDKARNILGMPARRTETKQDINQFQANIRKAHKMLRGKSG